MEREGNGDGLVAEDGDGVGLGLGLGEGLGLGLNDGGGDGLGAATGRLGEVQAARHSANSAARTGLVLNRDLIII